MVILIIFSFWQPNVPSQSSTPRREPAGSHHFVPHVLDPGSSLSSPSTSTAVRSLRSTTSGLSQPELVTVHNVAEDLSRIQQACAGDSEEVIRVHIPGDIHNNRVVLDVDGTYTDV